MFSYYDLQKIYDNALRNINKKQNPNAYEFIMMLSKNNFGFKKSVDHERTYNSYTYVLNNGGYIFSGEKKNLYGDTFYKYEPNNTNDSFFIMSQDIASQWEKICRANNSGMREMKNFIELIENKWLQISNLKEKYAKKTRRFF